MGLIICTMAQQSVFDDQSLESTNHHCDSDSDSEPCEFFMRDKKKVKKLTRRSSSPILSDKSSESIEENALTDCFEESSLENEENCIKFDDKGVQVNPRNLPRRRSAKTENVVRVTRSTTRRVSELPMLETMIETEEVSSLIMQADEDNEVMNSINEPLHETSETYLEPQTGSKNVNTNTLEDVLNSSRFSLEIPSGLSGLNASENNTENHNENLPENQEIKKIIILNINVSNAENNIIQSFSFEVPMDDKVENLNINLKPIELAKEKTEMSIPSTSNQKKKVTIMDNLTSDSDGKKSKGKKKYSKKRSKCYSSDSDCSCSDCFCSSSLCYSSSSDECCKKHCTLSRKDVKKTSSKKF